VFDAAYAELIEGGYAALSIDKIARRAGVAKTTVYRRWGSVERLVADLLADMSAVSVPIPDTGTVDADMHLLADAIADANTNPATRPLIGALVSAAARDPHAADVLAEFFAARHAQATGVIDRAILRGELPPDTDPLEVVRAVGAPFFYRMFITREPVDHTVARLAADAALAAARAGAYTRR
jgi:AcrR family transcriptional regulator